MKFLNIMQKEMKYQVKGIVFWLIIILTVFFLYTQFGVISESDVKLERSMQSVTRIQPARELDYYSEQLQADLERGQISQYEITESRTNLSSQAEEKMTSILAELKADDQSYYSEYNAALKELDQVLGGETIYSVKWRKYTFANDLSPTEEMNNIKNRLQNDAENQSTLLYGVAENIKPLPAEAGANMKSILKTINNQEAGVETYNSIRENLNKVDQIAGGNTVYGEKWRQILVREELYYQQALNELNNKLEQGLTASYGRLFSDYLGITAGFFPIFIGAFLLSRDRRTGMEELIRARKVNPYFYVGGKIVGVFLILGAFYLLLSLLPTFNLYQISMENGWDFHWFGVIKYVGAWILPSLLFVLSATVFVSEFTGSSLVAVGVQLIWLFRSMLPLKGDYSLTKYIIRFNTAGSHELYNNVWSNILNNRLFFLGLSFALILLTAKIWQKKDVADSGGYHVLGRLFKS
ncbi:MAG: hypothetical protein ACQEQG_10635 [Bacillota bacterium]